VYNIIYFELAVAQAPLKIYMLNICKYCNNCKLQSGCIFSKQTM